MKKTLLTMCAFTVISACADLVGPEVWFEVMGGNFRKDGLRLDLEAIRAAGFSGIHFFHIGRSDTGVWPGCEEQIPCLSEKWDDMVAFLGEECERLGLALTVQNCPGWSQSGGPWVPLSACQRDLAVLRRDFAGGEVMDLPAVPERYRDADSDWKDVAVLAFPTPAGDTGLPLKPASVEKKGDARIYRFSEPVTVRSLTLPGLHGWNTHYGYHQPWMRVTLEAKTADGWTEVVKTPLPVSSWRDYVETFTLACDEMTSDTWRFRVDHDFPIRKFGEPTFFSAARQTDWESKSGRVLRSLLHERAPKQSAGSRVRSSEIVDITGRTDWKVSEGRWTVLRIGHVNAKRVNAPAPKEATGWECDKLDPVGIEANFAGYIRRLKDGPLKGRMYGMMVDSWECFGQTWTPKMETYFREANGYGVRTMLPALFGWVIDDHETTERFLTAWRRTIGDLITRNYYGRMAELAHEHGLTAYYETAFGDIIHGDLLEYWKYADAPMCEYWFPHVGRDIGTVGSYAYKPVRPCASAAHIYGKKRVVAEAFTGMGIRWDEDFKRLQDCANRHFARGVTHLALQSYTHAPEPDALPPGGCMGGYNGTPFTRLQTWWKHMPEFTAWLTRCERFLEAGLPAQDVLWYLGDAVDHRPDADYPFPEGYRYDYLNHDVLTNRLTVRDGFFTVPEGTRWRILWVPDGHRMLPVTRAALERLSAAGGTVVFGGKDELVRALDGLVLAKDVATLPALGDEPSEDFMWIHRRVGGHDRYFVAAGTNGYCGKVTFRAEGVASVFDPVSCECHAWRNGDELSIPPSRSVFVEFAKNGDAVLSPLQNGEAKLLPLAPWTLTFPSGRRLTMDAPVSWSTHPELSCEERAFAGTAVYETSFDLDSVPRQLKLEMGKVESVADVWLNGEKVRTLWCEPYACDLAKVAKPGRNVLKIEITNTWRNRIIHDLGLPEKDRKTWILYRKGFNPGPDDPFVPAGIVGPSRVTVR